MPNEEDLIRDLGVRVEHGAAPSRMRSVELNHRLDARIGDSIRGEWGRACDRGGVCVVTRKVEAKDRASG